MYLYISLLMVMLSAEACNQQNATATKQVEVNQIEYDQETLDTMETAYFASGCFWCVEAIFESVEGVAEVISGYSGGIAKDANYKDVSAGITDHAEAVEVYYDPKVVTYETLLKVFFGSHDPTTLNRQGPDAGRQYRSEIYYKNDSEKIAANLYIKQLYSDGTFDEGSITTLVSALDKFYPAEDYHQNFERLNPNQGYVRAVSVPRLKKFQAKFPELLKQSKH